MDGVRLDKFLQVSRLVRRRVLANALCDGGRVERNGRPARASAEVAPGDVLRIDYGWRQLEVRVLEVPPGHTGRPVAAETLWERIREVRGAEPTSDEPTTGD